MASSMSKVGERVEVERRGDAALDLAQARRRRSWPRCRWRATAAARTPAGLRARRAPAASRRSRLLAETPPAMPTLRAPNCRAASNVRLDQRLDDDALEARAEIVRRPRRRAARRRSAPSGPARSARRAPASSRIDRRLEAGEAELGHRPTRGRRGATNSAGKRMAIAMRELRPRKRDGVVAAQLRAPIDRRPARIPESQQPRDLVVRLTRRVVARPADELIPAGRLDEVQAGVAARHDENQRPATARRRAREKSTRCARPGDARRRSADRAPPPRPSRTTTPTSSDPMRPGPCVTAIASTPAHATPASASARSTTPQMSRTCWRDAISGTTPPHSRWMSDLRRDDVGADAPRPRGIARRRHHGRGRFVARGLDAEDVHAALNRRRRLSPNTGRARCPSR